MTNGVFFVFPAECSAVIFFFLLLLSQPGFACPGKRREAASTALQGKSTGASTSYLMCVLTNMDQLQITQPGCREPHFGVSTSKTKHQLL